MIRSSGTFTIPELRRIVKRARHRHRVVIAAEKRTRLSPGWRWGRQAPKPNHRERELGKLICWLVDSLGATVKESAQVILLLYWRTYRRKKAPDPAQAQRLLRMRKKFNLVKHRAGRYVHPPRPIGTRVAIPHRGRMYAFTIADRLYRACKRGWPIRSSGDVVAAAVAHYRNRPRRTDQQKGDVRAPTAEPLAVPIHRTKIGCALTADDYDLAREVLRDLTGKVFTWE